MNKKLKKDWQNLVADAKGKCGALLFQYDDSIIAADDLMKEQQAEIEHYKNQLDRVCKDGNTPADFDKLRDANLALAMESHQQQAHIERLRAAGNKLHDWFGCGNTPDAVDLAYKWEEVESETPAQSLEALKREWSCPTIEYGTNRYGLDVSYFRSLFNRELNGTLQNYRPSELARNLLRMARTADSSIIEEDEFTGDIKREWQKDALHHIIKNMEATISSGAENCNGIDSTFLAKYVATVLGHYLDTDKFKEQNND